MSAGNIPWTAINEYAIRYEVNDLDAFDRFVKLIYALDESFFKTMENLKNGS